MEEIEIVKNWMDDCRTLGQAIHNNGRFSHPECPEHGWLFTRKKQSGKWIVWICTYDQDSYSDKISKSHWQFRIIKEHYVGWVRQHEKEQK